MSRKPPPRKGNRKPPPRKGRKPPKNHATAKSSVTVRKGSMGKVVHHEDKSEVVTVPIEPGESSIGVGHDIKYWASDGSNGLTVGASSYVKLSCGQTLEELEKANDIASELAYKFMHKNADRIREDLSPFLED